MQLQAFARKHRLDRYVDISIRQYGGTDAMWVTRRGAWIIIEHFRALQGRMWEKGRDWDVERGKRIDARKKRTAREQTERAQAKALACLAQLAPRSVVGCEPPPKPAPVLPACDGLGSGESKGL